MKKENVFSRPAMYIAAVVYIFIGYLTIAVKDPLADMLFAEDRYFENMGAFGFFAASFVFFYGFIRMWKRHSTDEYFRIRQLILLGFALFFFFGGGEEISWGQRIFNVQTPVALAEINAQEELNVHNIDLFEFKLKFETLFDLFWMSLTVALPLAVMFKKPIRDFVDRFFSVPPIGIGLLFVFNYLWAKVSELMFQGRFAFTVVPFFQAVQEIKESNYALLFILVAVAMVWDSSNM
jgi:hypothetical protein